MAVLFDAASLSADGFASSVTVAHTCSGSDRYLLAMAYVDSVQDRVTGVTYNGVAMTRLGAYDLGVTSCVYVYGLAAPASGTHNIVYSYNAAIGSDVGAISFTGVDQASPVSQIVGGGTAFLSSPVSQSITVASGGMGVGFIGAKDDLTNPFVAGSEQTQAFQNQALYRIAGEYQANATAMVWTWTGGGTKNGAASSIALSPSSGGGGGVTVPGTVGNAAASGSTATVTNTGNPTINGTLGNAAAAGPTASVTTRIMTDPLINNTDTVMASTAVHWSWIPAGRVGSMNGITITDGTGTTDANGRLAPGVTRVPGILKVAKRNTDATDDEVFYQAWN